MNAVKKFGTWVALVTCFTIGWDKHVREVLWEGKPTARNELKG